MKWLISMCTVMVLILAAPNAQAIDNSSFETGDLTGWTTVLPAGGTAGAVTSHTDTTWPGGVPPVVPGVTSWGPTDGSYFALIKTNGPGSLSQLYQAFTVPPGAKATLTLDYFWDSQDYNPFNDMTTGKILSGDGTGGPVESTLFSESVATDPGNHYGTPWTSVSYTFTSSGTYTLLIEIYNELDSGFDSYVGIDNVQLSIISLDIKPGSCPNPLNTNSKGVLPVAILATGDYDVQDIDVASIQLAGVAPTRSNYEDVAAPITDGEGEECECTEDGPDGYTDLTLKFDRQEIVDNLGGVNDGDVVPLTLTGTLLDGTVIELQDCVVIRAKKPE